MPFNRTLNIALYGLSQLFKQYCVAYIHMKYYGNYTPFQNGDELYCFEFTRCLLSLYELKIIKCHYNYLKHSAFTFSVSFVYLQILVRVCFFIIKLPGFIRCGPPADYASSLHLPDPGDCRNLSSALSHSCIVAWPVGIS